MNRVAVIGSTGQLGSDVVALLQETQSYMVVPLSRPKIECTEPASVHHVLGEVHPDVVVNCAAFVRVEECEDRPDEAFRVNTIGALNVARACADLGALCVYVSTDYVFDGEKGAPYTEEDAPQPVNVYGTSKAAGENLVRQVCPRWLIVRTASLFGKTGARGKGGNFVETVITKARRREPIRVVADIRMSPTYTRDASKVLEELLRQNAAGMVHITNTGSCTWYEFARTALDLLQLDARLEPVSSQEYRGKARRPRDSSLVSVRLLSFMDDGLPSWKDALRAYLVQKGYM